MAEVATERTLPVIRETAAPSELIGAISQRFTAMVQRELEVIAQEALAAAPHLSPSDGWRYDVFASLYVQLAQPEQPDAPALEPADAATEA